MTLTALEPRLFQFAFAGYAAACLLSVAYLFRRDERLPRWGFWILAAALAVHAGDLIARVVIARTVVPLQYAAEATAVAEAYRHYVPWSNWFEAFSLFAFVISAIFLAVEAKYRLRVLGAFVLPWAAISCIVAIRSPYGTAVPGLEGTAPMLPALHSVWMRIHVPVMFISYGCFANAFGIGIAYLLQQRQIKSKRPSEYAFALPSLAELDAAVYRLIAIGFPILTAGILLGARWAYDAWGTYWQWDPKETWALITWLVYLIYLHMRIVAGWRGRKTTYLSMVGFAVVLFTFVGVNYLSELHGFLSGSGR